jgi:hypothetical protein
MIEARPVRGFSADAAPGDNSTEHGAACGNAGRAAVARCEAERRSCCRVPVAYPAREANGHAPDTPESNTAPSSRADIASCFPRSHRRPADRRRKHRQACGTKHTPSNWPDCAPGVLVCQGKYILLVVVRFLKGPSGFYGSEWQNGELLLGRRFIGACSVDLGL